MGCELRPEFKVEDTLWKRLVMSVIPEKTETKKHRLHHTKKIYCKRVEYGNN